MKRRARGPQLRAADPAAPAVDILTAAGIVIAEPLVAGLAHWDELEPHPASRLRGRTFSLDVLVAMVEQADRGDGCSWAWPTDADTAAAVPTVVLAPAGDPTLTYVPEPAPGAAPAQARRLAVAASRMRWVRADGHWHPRSPGMTRRELVTQMRTAAEQA